ncbi:MAG: HAD hydrolase-like protein [Ilumatobacteraceae bacterium]
MRSTRIDLLTSDVFDTLVWRPVAEPHDLFVQLGAELRDGGLLPDHVTAGVFGMARQVAERRARTSAGRGNPSAECHLEEIWQEMPAVWRSASEGTWDRYIEAELKCEERELRPIARGVELLRVAHGQGCRVVLVSDTYFSPVQLERLLGAAGVPLDLVTSVLTSSDRRVNKIDGLLEIAIREHDVDPTRVLHIGDNPIADIRAANRVGASSAHVDVPDTDRISDAMPLALHRFSESAGTDGGADGIGRALLLDRWSPESGVAAAYQFGATVGGPLLAGFADWIVAQAAELGVSTVHYLLREGGFIADVVAALRPDAPTAELLHASRWVNMRATVYDATAEELFRALARRTAFDPSHVTEAFGVDPRLVRDVIGETPVDDPGRVAAIEALADDDEIRGLIVEASSMLRARLLRYLEPRLHPENGRMVVCDIGWGGTIQESLTDLLHREGWDVEVTGLYLLLSAPGRERVARGALMRGFLPDGGIHRSAADIVMRTPEIPEQLCTPDLGTLRDIDDDAQPITAPVPTVAIESRRLARAGVLDFVAERRAAFPEAAHDRRLHGNAYAAALLEGLAGTIAAPDRRLAIELGAWEHDDVQGTGHEMLINPAAVGTVQFLNAADTDQVGMRELYWVPGAAAVHNPALAAQLDAVRLGVDASVLCPPSELGAGLIAVFAPDTLDAVAQVQLVPHRSADGWMLLRLTAPVGDVRSIRIDFGAHGGLVELGHLTISEPARVGAEPIPIARLTDLDDDNLDWVDGWPTARRHAVVAAGGHLVVPWATLTATTGPASGWLSVEVTFRAWRLDEAELASFSPTMRARWRSITATPRRVVRRSAATVRNFSQATAARRAAPEDAPASPAPQDL